jgi:hypothetical protein
MLENKDADASLATPILTRTASCFRSSPYRNSTSPWTRVSRVRTHRCRPSAAGRSPGIPRVHLWPGGQRHASQVDAELASCSGVFCSIGSATCSVRSNAVRPLVGRFCQLSRAQESFGRARMVQGGAARPLQRLSDATRCRPTAFGVTRASNASAPTGVRQRGLGLAPAQTDRCYVRGLAPVTRR